MHYSVCLPAVCSHMEVNEALAAVKSAGYERYEIWGWWGMDMEALHAAQQKENLQIAAMCTRMVSLTDASCRAEYIKGLQETAVICHKMGCKTVISQVGQELSEVPRELQHQSIVDGLRACVPILQENDLTLVIEPLNTRINHKGYYLWSAEEAFQIIDEVADPHVKVLYDMYHQYVMDDLNLEILIRNIHKIGHFHMAGYPGRHEPLQDSEIDYPKILRVIRDSGYQESIGLEYFPVHDAKEGLMLLHRQLQS